MKFLLQLANGIDTLNQKIGNAISWSLFLAVLICAGNALLRYALNSSSNAWLEIQWVLFSASFLLSAAHTLRRNEHVRIDVLAGRLSRRAQVWLDLFGFLFFLLPVCALILRYGTPFALTSISNQEVSSNAGGLIVWPAKCLIPLGFFLLALQAFSEIIKRIGFLFGMVDGSTFVKASASVQPGMPSSVMPPPSQ